MYSIMGSMGPVVGAIHVFNAIAWNSGCCLICYPILSRGLNVDGLVAAWCLGCVLLAAFGWKGYIAIALFFVGGTVATKFGRKWTRIKKETSSPTHDTVKRGANSVISSGIAGALCALLKLNSTTLFSGRTLQVAYIASLTSKLGDTVSSEIGKSIGTKTYLITTLKQVKRGIDGAVSLEGSISGAGAAVVYLFIVYAIGLVRQKLLLLLLIHSMIFINTDNTHMYHIDLSSFIILLVLIHPSSMISCYITFYNFMQYAGQCQRGFAMLPISSTCEYCRVIPWCIIAGRKFKLG